MVLSVIIVPFIYFLPKNTYSKYYEEWDWVISASTYESTNDNEIVTITDAIGQIAGQTNLLAFNLYTYI